ncbi:ATP-binding protein [Magnetospirillum sp. UT-4]|uniref:ATP-binding protein n=1 Tax=Magnetospirillum sp. UT-4 TaxID=2681467 RepID=UPI0015730137|nr:ATP-binding protein [Magnetospirillum sp. UT-4]
MAARAIIPPASGIHGRDPCEREQIQAPGCIQPPAALLCLDPGDLCVLAATPNLAEVLGAPTLPETISVRLSNAVADGSARAGTEFVAEDGRLTVFAHVQDNVLLVEFEAHLPEDAPDAGGFFAVNAALSEMGRAVTLESLSDIAAGAIQSLTGMERVLIYRFDGEGHGEVIAEALAPGFDESFLGFSFPAADIPIQARTLYLTSPVRFTARREYDPIAIVPADHPVTGKPFDIGRCRSRSLSPVHRAYQENLGVDGAMSLSIVNDGKLWGLVVGHHRKPHRVPIPARQQAMAVASALSMRLSATETAEERDARARHVVMHARLLEQIAGADDFVSPLIDGDVRLTDLFFASSGAAVVYRQGEGTDEHLEIRTVGEAPDAESVLVLSQLCRDHLHDGVFATDCVSRIMPAFSRYAAAAAGMLAITIGENGRHMIIWFRPETVSTRVWGGASPAQVEAEKRLGNYYPRRSFARWVEERRGHSRAWPTWKIEIARSLRTALNDVILRQMRTIRALNTRLAESDRAKSRLLSHMSHELRTPLNAILGFSEMLDTGIYGTITDSQQTSVRAITEAGRHLLSMVNDILDLSKVEAGRLELHEREIDLAEVVTRIANLLREMAGEQGLSIVVRLDPAIGAVLADERLVKQMLLNLLSNGIKFTPRGGTLTVSAAPGDDGEVVLRVADTGRGIPREKLARVLEPFRQAHDEVTLAHPGTGLGLPIVKALIELHGGTLEIESTVGVGTTVSLRFPAERAVPSQAPP